MFQPVGHAFLARIVRVVRSHALLISGSAIDKVGQIGGGHTVFAFVIACCASAAMLTLRFAGSVFLTASW